GTPKQQCPLRMQVLFGPNSLRTSRSSHGSTVTIGFDGFPNTALANIDTSLSFNGNEIFATPSSVVMPGGSLHQLAPAVNNTMVAPDGSGYFSSGNGNLTGSNGTLYSPVVEDRNGNQMGTADTLGRQIPTVPGPSSPDSTLPPSTASLVSCPALNY